MANLPYGRAEQPAMFASQRTVALAPENSYPMCICYYPESGGCQRYAVVNEKYCVYCLDEESNWTCRCKCTGCPTSLQAAVATKVASPNTGADADADAVASSDSPVETAAPAAFAGARAEQPGIAEVRVAQLGVAAVLVEQPDERWKSRADKQVQCGRCDRCRIMIAIADVSLCGNCFYETDASFKCDRCGFHEKDFGGLDHRSGRKLCRPCFDIMEQIERHRLTQRPPRLAGKPQPDEADRLGCSEHPLPRSATRARAARKKAGSS